MSQQHWDANDFQGRIKVEISEGYLRSDHVFVKLMNHGIFNFQPAPMGRFCVLSFVILTDAS